MTVCQQAQHDALKADRVRWAALPLVGVRDYGDMVLELRNCRCGSTIAIETTETKGNAP